VAGHLRPPHHLIRTAEMLLTGTGRLLMARPDGASAPMTLSPWAVELADGVIRWVGSPNRAPSTAARVDVGNALVTPGLVDSHTHPVFAGDRSDEVAARLEGAAYDGGGILRTAAATRAVDDATLERLVAERLGAALASGVTTVECKSGYGLSLDEELRHLRVLRTAAGRAPVHVVRTFLGAHAIPAGATAADHAASVADDMIPTIAADGLADFVDVFCDRGFFSLADARRIGAAARASGLGLRLHADQLALTGAAALGAELGAASVDHLEQLDASGVAGVAGSSTVATLLPGPALVMRDRLPPARALLDAGATVAVASDANAGTFGDFGAMPRVIGLAATVLGMTVSEAVAAATVGAAAALRLADRGVIEAGATADIVAWDAEHEGAFALRLGAVRPLRTWIGGVEV
jgi:imidazolonepropionase